MGVPFRLQERKAFICHGYFEGELRGPLKGGLTICRNEGFIRIAFRLDQKGYPRGKDDAPAREGMSGNGGHQNHLGLGMGNGSPCGQVVCGRTGGG